MRVSTRLFRVLGKGQFNLSRDHCDGRSQMTKRQSPTSSPASRCVPLGDRQPVARAQARLTLSALRGAILTERSRKLRRTISWRRTLLYPTHSTSTDSFDFSPQLEMMRRAHRAGKVKEVARLTRYAHRPLLRNTHALNRKCATASCRKGRRFGAVSASVLHIASLVYPRL